MKRLQAALAVVALAAAVPAFGQDGGAPAGETGLQLGARVAYAWPFGDLVEDFSIDELADGAVPVWLEGNYRLNRDLAFGVYGQWSPIMEADLVDDDLTIWRLGGQLIFRLAERGSVLPWLGLGAGWQWLKGDDDAGTDVDGFEAMVQGGADFKVAQGFNVGPFVSFSLGTFGEQDVVAEGPLGTPIAATADAGWHEWLQVGVRGTFDF